MDKYLSIHKVSIILGVTPQTLRKWDTENYFIPAQRRNNGYRYYTEKQVTDFANKLKNVKEKNCLNVGYCRVSKIEQKNDLQKQYDTLKSHLQTFGRSYKIIQDIGTGIDCKKAGFIKLLEIICKNDVDTVYITSNDILTNIGFNFVDIVAKFHNTKIIALNSTNNVKEPEIVEDIVQILNSYGLNMSEKLTEKTKLFLQELLEDRDD